jgi:hypothetical protein
MHKLYSTTSSPFLNLYIVTPPVCAEQAPPSNQESKGPSRSPRPGLSRRCGGEQIWDRRLATSDTRTDPEYFPGYDSTGKLGVGLRACRQRRKNIVTPSVMGPHRLRIV